jgi:hypothetical protein
VYGSVIVSFAALTALAGSNVWASALGALASRVLTRRCVFRVGALVRSMVESAVSCGARASLSVVGVRTIA